MTDSKTVVKRKLIFRRRGMWLSGVCVILVSATIVFSRYQDSPHTIVHQVVAVYPHDPSAFTQGLYFENGFLFEGTGRRGESALCREIASGARPKAL